MNFDALLPFLLPMLRQAFGENVTIEKAALLAVRLAPIVPDVLDGGQISAENRLKLQALIEDVAEGKVSL